MGCAGSKSIDNSYALHPPLLEEHVYALQLPVPPQNGYDSFLTLQWCRDLQEERDAQAQAEKAAAKKAKKKKKDTANVPSSSSPPPKKYYLCLVCKFEPYEDNKTINLQKQPHAWKELPKWQDPDFMEDILCHGPFYQNDAFLLAHVPTAIRQPADYAYTEQYRAAYRHWKGGRDPTDDELTNHQIRVARTLLTELRRYERNHNRDAKGRDRSRTVQKLKDILTSLQYDVSILRQAEAQVVAQEEEEAAAAAAAEADKEAKQSKKKQKNATKATDATSKEDGQTETAANGGDTRNPKTEMTPTQSEPTKVK